jgi:two-component system response regulator MtrA
VDERVLLVEDDPSIREVTSLGLRGAGLSVETAADGREALVRFRAEPTTWSSSTGCFRARRPRGLQEIRRSSRVPILMLSAGGYRRRSRRTRARRRRLRDETPAAELVSRIRASCRTHDPPVEEVLRVGELEIETAGFRATRDGAELQLTATEFRLLLELARRPGQVFTRELLLERVWGYEYLGDSRLVDIAVQRLRTKIEGEPGAPGLITTVRGVGYRLERGR